MLHSIHRWSAAIYLVFTAAGALAAMPAVPPGFEIRPVAAAPLVGHPMMACLDDRGRLFVAESAGMNMDEKQLDAARPNFIRMLEDTDGDGVFDKSTIFAGKLMIPNGAQWLDGSLYVAEPPGIWKFTDTDGDGVAEQREHITANVSSNGMSSTLHGPVLHPSGRLFWCGGQGGFELDKTKTPSGRMVPGVFSFRPDGSQHEIFALGGTANPVEVCFSPTGDVFGTIAILDFPDGARHDALMHWVYGGVSHHNATSQLKLKRTGPFIPPLSHVGQVAPAGLVFTRTAALGPDYRGNIFWSQFNTHKVIRTIIEPRGAGYKSRDEDFLVSGDVDFHATDVLEDADGSLLVVDTGGWFRHGCPTSTIARPQAKGAIYRIRRGGAQPEKDPRGLKIKWTDLTPKELVIRLGDTRPAVVDRAMAALAKGGETAFDAIAEKQAFPDDQLRVNLVWAASRLGTRQAMDLLQTWLGDPEPSVRHAAANAIGQAQDAAAAQALLKQFPRETDAAVRREIAAALGRLGEARAVPLLLDHLRMASDPYLTHALIYALIQINQPEATTRGLAADHPATRRGALLALSQMEHVKLTGPQIAPLLRSEDVDLAGAAMSVAGRDPALADELVAALRESLASPKPMNSDRAALITATLAELAPRENGAQIIGSMLQDAKLPPESTALLLEVVKQANVRKMPEAWIAGLKAILLGDSISSAIGAANVAAERRMNSLDAPLRELMNNESKPAALRLACAAAAAPRLKSVEPAFVQFVSDRLGNGQPVTARLEAARLLAMLPLDASQRIALAPRLSQADAMVLSTLLRAFEKGESEPVGLALVQALQSGSGAANLPPDELARLIGKYPPAVGNAAKPLLAKLGVDPAAQKAKLDSLSELLAGGDIGRGKQIFFGPVAACATCHRVSGQGGLLGPNLTTIAEIRSGRDLLESVIYPGASIVQGFRPYVVQTRDGRAIVGLLTRQTADAFWFRGIDQVETRLDAANIASMTEAASSLMPQGLDARLSRDELRDLMAFLQGCKRLSSFLPDQH